MEPFFRLAKASSKPLVQIAMGLGIAKAGHSD